MKKPKKPVGRRIREGTMGTCPNCHSTEQRRFNWIFFRFGKKIGCINPDCENYYKK